MTPEQLLDPAEFPDDLKWVPAHYRLHPKDPVYLLLGWHWRRVKQSEDTLAAAVAELKATLDGRIRPLTEAAGAVAAVSTALDELQRTLDAKPAEFGERLDSTLRVPLEKALGQIRALEKSVEPLAKSMAVSNRRQLLAALVTGVCLGVLSSVIVLLG